MTARGTDHRGFTYALAAAKRDTQHENRDGSLTSGWGRGARGFWNKVRRRDDGCWDWTGYLDPDGVGKFTAHIGGRQITYRAPRYAWEQIIGPAPADRVLVAVVCWNRKCVNPAHREPLPQSAVVAWINAVGRPVDRADTRGEMSGRALLREDQVREIVSYRGIYGAAPLLAQLHGVSVHHVRALMSGRAWRHVSRNGPRAAMPMRLLRQLARDREFERHERSSA